MNNDRRKALDEIVARLFEIGEEVAALRDEEQEYFDNMPEGFQQGEKGQAAKDAISQLDEAASSIESAIDAIHSATAA